MAGNGDAWAALDETDYADEYVSPKELLRMQSKDTGAAGYALGLTEGNIIPLAVGAGLGLTAGYLGGTTSAGTSRMLGRIGTTMQRGAAASLTYGLLSGQFENNPAAKMVATARLLQDPTAAAAMFGADYFTGGRASSAVTAGAVTASAASAAHGTGMEASGRTPKQLGFMRIGDVYVHPQTTVSEFRDKLAQARGNKMLEARGMRGGGRVLGNNSHDDEDCLCPAVYDPVERGGQMYSNECMAQCFARKNN